MDKALLQLLRAVSEEEQAILDGAHTVQKALYTTGGGFTVRQDKMAKGRLIDVRTHTRFVDFPAHRHNYIEMLYMCSGQTHHLINGTQPLTLREGEILLFNQHSSHAISAASEGDIGVNFIIQPVFFHTAFDMMDGENLLSDFILDSLVQNDARPKHLHFKVAKVVPVQNLMENLIWNLKFPGPGSDRLNRLTMGLLFQHLLDNAALADVNTPQPFRSRVARQAMQYIEEHYADASLTELARTARQPDYALSRLIKQETGVTFKELVQIKRFSVALRLLRTTSLSVSDIISSVGYDNTSYFHRQFRAKYGMSPAEYRRAYADSGAP